MDAAAVSEDNRTQASFWGLGGVTPLQGQARLAVLRHYAVQPTSVHPVEVNKVPLRPAFVAL